VYRADDLLRGDSFQVGAGGRDTRARIAAAGCTRAGARWRARGGVGGARTGGVPQPGGEGGVAQRRLPWLTRRGRGLARRSRRTAVRAAASCGPPSSRPRPTRPRGPSRSRDPGLASDAGSADLLDARSGRSRRARAPHGSADRLATGMPVSLDRAASGERDCVARADEAAVPRRQARRRSQVVRADEVKSGWASSVIICSSSLVGDARDPAR
jgi:hypothetical protein